MTQERLFLRLEEDAVCGPETDTPAAAFRAFAVDPALRPYVAQILLYRETFPAGRETLERVLPDGAVRLAFHLGDAPFVGDGTGDGPGAGPGNGPSGAMEAIGAASAPVLVRLRGAIDGLTVTLRPGAAAALLGVPAGVIAQTAVQLEDLWGSEVRALRNRLLHTRGDAQRVAVLQAALLQRIERVPQAAPDALSARVARQIAAAGGRLRLRDIASAAGVGERRLQQLFFQHIGLSPRSLSRLARMHDCLRTLRAQPQPAWGGWADWAVDRGFYDQAHLVNEFRALAGITPAQFLRRTVSESSNTAD